MDTNTSILFASEKEYFDSRKECKDSFEEMNMLGQSLKIVVSILGMIFIVPAQTIVTAINMVDAAFAQPIEYQPRSYKFIFCEYVPKAFKFVFLHYLDLATGFSFDRISKKSYSVLESLRESCQLYLDF